MKPTHIDYTTLYGASRAIEPKDLSMGLPLSRLLSLNQFIEAIVLNDCITYEIGTSPDWQLYSDLLENSQLMRNAKKFDLPLRRLNQQIDNDYKTVKKAVKWAVDVIPKVDLQSLLWALHFRLGTYEGVLTGDENIRNPIVLRYLEIANSIQDRVFSANFNKALQILYQNGIGSVGFSIMVRIGIFKHTIISTGTTYYFPHYSRQPIFTSLADRGYQIHTWTIEQIRNIRKTILRKNQELEKNEDNVLSQNLSPIFVACLNNAKHPEQIIENAIILRESRAAKDYRKELTSVLEQSAINPEAYQLYKTRIGERIRNLNDLLFHRGVKEESSKSWNIGSRIGIPFLLNSRLGFSYGARITHEKRNIPGDRTAIFLSDILRQALGIVQVEAKLSKIFMSNFYYDTGIIAFARPKDFPHEHDGK